MLVHVWVGMDGLVGCLGIGWCEFRLKTGWVVFPLQTLLWFGWFGFMWVLCMFSFMGDLCWFMYWFAWMGWFGVWGLVGVSCG